MDSNLMQSALVTTFIWMAIFDTYTGIGEEGRGVFGGGRVPV